MNGDVETGGGAHVGRDVNTGGGNFAGRDEKSFFLHNTNTNASTPEWREGVYIKLESYEQRISQLEMSDHVRRGRDRMTTYEKFVLIGFLLLIVAFGALAYEMRNLTAQLDTSDRTEQLQRARP